ncbi:hypothetical protein HMPREF1624_02228 [Sporothrix schenckii ATCC 58251]|uniref:Uncharacterized protein n=1 Tax=Sporothrix schenckii (strain ATCC 58251 / de Perez 2211183) TaxID=1391915 RepID=U7Q1E8_SPOS1|nr:hypothetical protein HMPREF1624_02228 [Sporothrix schenckii ATCC 58251]
MLDAVLKPFVLAGGKAPVPLATPSSDGASYATDMVKPSIEWKLSTRAEQTKLRNDCLSRDGYRCVYTGIWDFNKAARAREASRALSVELAETAQLSLALRASEEEAEARDKVLVEEKAAALESVAGSVADAGEVSFDFETRSAGASTNEDTEMEDAASVSAMTTTTWARLARLSRLPLWLPLPLHWPRMSLGPS